jgi:hypothetical protein
MFPSRIVVNKTTPGKARWARTGDANAHKRWNAKRRDTPPTCLAHVMETKTREFTEKGGELYARP